MAKNKEKEKRRHEVSNNRKHRIGDGHENELAKNKEWELKKKEVIINGKEQEKDK